MTATRFIDQTIRRHFPHPVAATWHRASLATSDTERTRCLLACIEVLVRTLTALLLTDYLRGAPAVAVEQQLARLNRPSLGQWVGLIREMLRALRGRAEARRKADEGTAEDSLPPAPFMPEAIDWYFPKGRPGEAARLLDALVSLRNQEAHGHALSAAESGDRALRLLTDLRSLFAGMTWLTGYRPFRVLTHELSRRGGFRGKVQFLTGLEPQSEPVAGRWSARLFPEATYLSNPAGDGVLEISPFISVRFDPGPRADRVFLLAATRKGKKVVLRNDSTGRDEAVLMAGEDGEQPFDDWLAGREELFLWQANPGAADVLKAPVWERDRGGETGQVLGERFELRRELGKGGMASVYLVWDRWDEAEFALKVLHAELGNEDDFRERFKREARTMRRLHHRNILKVEETNQLADGRLYLKLPLITGGTLAERITTDGLPPERVHSWALQMLGGLTYLHEQGVVHRDIKPSNYLVDSEEQLLLADFGIALGETDTRLTRALERMGSMAYMSPEQRRGGHIDAASDVFSLGVVLDELLSGQSGNPTPGQGLGGTLGELIRRMTTDDPAHRPSASEALRALTAAGPEVGAAPPPVPVVAEPSYFYHGEGEGQQELPLPDVVEKIAARREVRHLLWQPGWTSWKNWDEVDEVARRLTSMPAPPPPPPGAADGTQVEMVFVSADRFAMGRGLRPVTLTRDFRIALAPVSQDLFEKVMGANPVEEAEPETAVHSVSWLTAIEFCNRLSERHGLQPAYRLSEPQPRKKLREDDILRFLGRLSVRHQVDIFETFGDASLSVLFDEPARLTEVPGVGERTAEELAARAAPRRHALFTRQVQWDPRADGYRLPTEAEWAFACRAGRDDDALDPTENPWGLEAMCSDRWEWTWDAARLSRYATRPEPLPPDPALDPAGQGEGDHRLIRGGAAADPWERRVALEATASEQIGLRLVLSAVR